MKAQERLKTNKSNPVIMNLYTNLIFYEPNIDELINSKAII